MTIAEIAAQFIAWSQTLVDTWGYLGIFLVNLIGSASIIFPVPAFLITFGMGAVLNPWLVGIVAAIGAAIGEVTGYLIGYGGREAIKDKHKKWLEKAEKWMQAHGVFFVIVIFAASPLPDDVTGILAGVISYNWKRFLLASFIGKLIMSLALAWGGYFGVSWVLQFFGGIGF